MTSEQIIRYLRIGYDELVEHETLLNSMNVFPIPDKDTGTNLIKSLSWLESDSSDVISDIMWYSKGSSGNILACFLCGLITAIDDGKPFNESAKCGYDFVMSSVDNPRRGTMVDLMEECSKEHDSFDDLYVSCIREWADGQNRLDILKECHTLDSGALGVLMLFEGISKMCGVSHMDMIDELLSKCEYDKNRSDDYPRYCIEFMIPDDGRFKAEYLENLGNELVINRQDGMLKIHIHANRPYDVVEMSRRYGQLENLKIDDNGEYCGK